MIKQIPISILLITLLLSCGTSSQKQLKEADKNTSTTIENQEAFSSQSTGKEIKDNFLKGAQIDDLVFDQLFDYDNYYHEEVERFYQKRKNGDEVFVATIFQDRLRHLKMLVGQVSGEDLNNGVDYYQKTVEMILDGVNNGTYQVEENKYLRIMENNEVWYHLFLMTEDKVTGSQSFYCLMSPRRDLGYLKHLTENFADVRVNIKVVKV